MKQKQTTTSSPVYTKRNTTPSRKEESILNYEVEGCGSVGGIALSAAC